MSVFLGRSGFRRRLREFNPCHDPKTGMFAPKGQGECGPGNWEDAGRQRSIYGNFIDDPNLLALDRQEATELGRAVNNTQASDANDQKHALANELADTLRERFEGRMHLIDELHDELLRRGLDTHIDEVVGSSGNSSEYPDPADVESDYDEYKEQAEQEAMERHDEYLANEYEVYAQKMTQTVRDFAEEVRETAEDIQAIRRDSGEVDPTTQGTLPEFDPRTNASIGLRALMEHALGPDAEKVLNGLDEGDNLELDEAEIERISDFLSRNSAYARVVDDLVEDEDIRDVLKDSGHDYFDGNSYGDGFSKWREDNDSEMDTDNIMSFNSWYSDRYGIDPEEWNSGGDGNGTVSRDDFEDTAYAVSSFLLHTWAETSGDSNVISVGLQQAAEKVFDLGPTYAGLFVKDKHGTHGGGEEFIRRTRAFYDGHKEVLDSFLKGMHENTQKFLSDKYKGDYVTLYRGMRQPSTLDAGWESLKDSVLGDSKLGAMVDVLLQPISSFSISLTTARNFTGSDGVVFAVRVPKSRILSTTATGFGAMNEHEVTVLGGRYPAFTSKGGYDDNFWKIYESYKRKQPVATEPFPGEAW